MADDIVPTKTTKTTLVIEPIKVQHCNSRTGYTMVVHWFNPGECTECNSLLTFIGKRAAE